MSVLQITIVLNISKLLNLLLEVFINLSESILLSKSNKLIRSSNVKPSQFAVGIQKRVELTDAKIITKTFPSV